MTSPRDRLRLLWRMLRVTTAAYFVLGTDRTAHLRLRVDSAWDWLQAYELRALEVAPRDAGQPEVGWNAYIRRRSDRAEAVIQGHVEIRWSHGRFFGSPESKVYLDTPHADVPGYNVAHLARHGLTKRVSDRAGSARVQYALRRISVGPPRRTTAPSRASGRPPNWEPDRSRRHLCDGCHIWRTSSGVARGVPLVALRGQAGTER